MTLTKQEAVERIEKILAANLETLEAELLRTLPKMSADLSEKDLANVVYRSLIAFLYLNLEDKKFSAIKYILAQCNEDEEVLVASACKKLLINNSQIYSNIIAEVVEQRFPEIVPAEQRVIQDRIINHFKEKLVSPMLASPEAKANTSIGFFDGASNKPVQRGNIAELIDYLGYFFNTCSDWMIGYSRKFLLDRFSLAEVDEKGIAEFVYKGFSHLNGYTAVNICHANFTKESEIGWLKGIWSEYPGFSAEDREEITVLAFQKTLLGAKPCESQQSFEEKMVKYNKIVTEIARLIGKTSVWYGIEINADKVMEMFIDKLRTSVEEKERKFGLTSAQRNLK